DGAVLLDLARRGRGGRRRIRRLRLRLAARLDRRRASQRGFRRRRFPAIRMGGEEGGRGGAPGLEGGAGGRAGLQAGGGLRSQVMPTVRTRSAAYFARYSFGCAPPSRVTMFRRLKQVAARCSTVGLGSRSPASCSMVNWSNGLFRLKESIT